MHARICGGCFSGFKPPKGILSRYNNLKCIKIRPNQWNPATRNPKPHKFYPGHDPTAVSIKCGKFSFLSLIMLHAAEVSDQIPRSLIPDTAHCRPTRYCGVC